MTKIAPSSSEAASAEGRAQKGEECPPSCYYPAAAAWERFDVADPKFFADLHIAKDGGFSEVDVLFDTSRFVWALFTLVLLVLNLGFIISPNVDALLRFKTEEWIGNPEVSSRALLLSNLWIWIFDTDSVPKPQVLLAFLELGMLLFYLGKTAICLFQISRRDPISRWHGCAELFWDVIPQLSNFSAMKSLNFVTPKVLLPAAITVIRRTVSRRGRRYGLPLLRFTVFRILCFLVGFEAFVIKFNTAAVDQTEDLTFIPAASAALAFLNQMLGIVDVNRFAHRRLFVYIFGGEDGFMSDREEMIARTYLAMLVRRIWVLSSEKKFRVSWFLAVALSYADEDFQRLTLREGKLWTDPALEKPQAAPKVTDDVSELKVSTA